MRPDEVTPEFSLVTLKSDPNTMRQVLQRFERARNNKLHQIQNQIDTVGSDGVKIFSDAVNNFCERWGWRLPEETMSSAIDIVKAFEDEDLSDLRYRIPEENGGFLKEEDMTEDELAEFQQLKNEKEGNNGGRQNY